MAINITCPGCQSVYPVGENLVGKTIRCKKCGEMMPVTAPAPVAARPAAKAAAVVDDDDDALPAKPVRKGGRDYGDDGDDTPRSRPDRGAKTERKGSKLPLLLGGMIGLIVLGAAGIGVAFATGAFGDSDAKPNDVAVSPPNREPVTPPAVTPPNGGGDTEGAKAGPTAKGTNQGGLAPPIAITNTNTVAPPPAGVPSSTPTISHERMMSGQMDKVASDLVARATVLVDTEDTQGSGGQGTGWFGLEPGLVFTNAHVIGMKAPDSKPPAKLTLHLYKPDPNTPGRIISYRTIPHQRIKILGVDRHNDLACLQVTGEADLPTPLKIRPSAELQVRQGMTVYGFPLGSMLNRFADAGKDQKPEMSVRPTTMTAIRYDHLNRIKHIQIEGGAISGNSGSAYVDAEGTVVGVHVAGVRDPVYGGRTQIGWGVPTEYVFGLVAGRVDEVEFDQAYKHEGKIRVPVTLRCLDAMKRLQKVGIRYWVGDPKGEPRNPGEKPADKKVDDTDHKSVELKYDPATRTATGEIEFPPPSADRGYWVQPYFVNTLRPQGYYNPGQPIAMTGPPVDRTATELQVKLQTGTTRPIELAITSDVTEFIEGESESKDERALIKSTLKMTEAVRPGNPQQGAAATLLFKYQSIDLQAQVGQFSQDAPKRLLEILNQNVSRMEAIAMVNNRGQIFRYQSSVRDVPNQFLGALLQQFTDGNLEALQECSIPLPNKRVNPLETWESKRTYRLFMQSDLGAVGAQAAGPGGPGGQPQPKQPQVRELKFDEHMTYTYLGIRQRLGNQEAVIRINGKIVTTPGSKEAATGHAKGYVMVELNTGTVVLSDIETEFEVDSSSRGLKKKVSGLKKYNLVRGSSIR